MFDSIPSPVNFTSSIIDPLLPPNPYSIFFDSAIGRLNVIGNSLDNHLYEGISTTGYLELTLDENHFSSDPNSEYFYTGIAGATQDTLTSINFDGKDGRDSLFIGYTGGNQTVKSLNIQTEDDLIISGNIFTDFITTNADTLTVKNSNITTSANNQGGTVQLLGNRVEVLNSNLNASGNLSGGSILIGGDYQGKGQVQNAQTTFVSKDSTIQANALQSGNGGKVIIWADGDTDFRGDIKARGGAKSGDGGFVEVSGKQNLNFVGDVDVDAPNGKQGTVLLDPADIIINAEDDDDETFDISDLYKLKGNINLSASNSIIFNTDAYFDKAQGTISLQAGGEVNLLGKFSTGGRNLSITGGSINTTDALYLEYFDNNEYRSGDIRLISKGEINLGRSSGVLVSIFGSASVILEAGTFITTGALESVGNIKVTAKANITIVGANNSTTNKTKGNNVTLLSTGGNIKVSDPTDEYSAGISTFSMNGNAGSVTLTAYGNIETESILASANGNGLGGIVKLTSETGKIDTNGQVINISAQNGNAGSVILEAFSDVLTNIIDASSKVSGNGGTAKLTSDKGKINTNGQGINTSAQNGNAGNVILNASSDISTSGIFAYANGAAGNIKISSVSGSIQTDTIDANSKTERWGDVSIKAATDIKTNSIKGGTVAINSTSGSITLDNAGIETSSAKGASASINVKSGNKIKLGEVRSNLNFDNGNAGNIKIEAVNQVSLNSVFSRSSQAFNSGNIKILSQNAGIDFTWTGDNNPGISTRSEAGIAGNITVEASGNITKNALDGEIRSWSDNGGKAGNVKIASNNGKVLLGKTPVRAWADVNDAGSVKIEAAGDLEIGAMETYSKGTGNGGDTYLSSSYGNIISGYIRSDSVKANGGDITLNAFAENGGGGGGTIRVISSFNLDGIDFSIFAGISGSPLLKIGHAGALVGGGAFTVGDAKVNGTAGIIMAGGDVIIDTSEIKGVYTLGNIKITTFTLTADDPTLIEIKKRVQKSFVQASKPIGIDLVTRQAIDGTGIPALVLYLPELKRLWASKELAIEAASNDPKLKSNGLLAASSVFNDIRLLLTSADKYNVKDRAQIAYIISTASWEVNLGIYGALFEDRSRTSSINLYYYDRNYFLINNNRQYARNGNLNELGNLSPEDGYTFRGRGYVQLTGRVNYEKFKSITGVDIVSNPDLVANDRKLAAEITVLGMRDDLFGSSFPNPSQGLSRYIRQTDPIPDFAGARTIVNRYDPQSGIITQAIKYWDLLKKIKY